MKILFIGGTGNISEDCAALLYQRGHEIHVVSRGHRTVPPAYRTIVVDRKDHVAMREALGRGSWDVVINFLGYDLTDVCIDHACFKDAVGQYIFISSTSVLVKPLDQFPITEKTPVGNVWWDYAQKKQACEEWLLQQWMEERYPVTIVRPSHTYSKRWIPNPVSSASYSFAARLVRGLPVFVPDDGENPWTLTASSDFALGLAGLVGHDAALGETFHITSDEVLTWNRIVTEIAAAVGAPSPQIVKVPTDFICRIAPSLTGTLKGDKAHPGVFDNSKIKRFVPDFHCCKPFRVGVAESAAWLHAHPEQQHPNPQVDAMCDAVITAWQHP